MDTINKIIKLISHITDENDEIEFELKFILDDRIKIPNYIKRYNVPILNKINLSNLLFNKCESFKKTQTINFIQNTKDFSSLIKQLYFENDKQIKEMKNFYIKKSLFPSIILESNDFPLIKLNCNTEKKIPNSTNNIYNNMRFKERYSINLNSNWRLDITLVYEYTDLNIISNINEVKKLIKNNFCKNDINSHKIEFELEYINKIKCLNINNIKNGINLMETFIKNNNILEQTNIKNISHNNIICDIAKL